MVVRRVFGYIDIFLLYIYRLQWPESIGCLLLRSLRPVKGLVIALMVVLALLIVSLQLGSEWLFYGFWVHLGKTSGAGLEIQTVDAVHVDTHTHIYICIYIYTIAYLFLVLTRIQFKTLTRDSTMTVCPRCTNFCKSDTLYDHFGKNIQSSR